MQEIQTQQEQYPWLKDLELGAENQGCYRDGEWKATGGGEVTSVNPHNNKPIGKTFLASVDDYDKCVKAMQKEKEDGLSSQLQREERSSGRSERPSERRRRNWELY